MTQWTEETWAAEGRRRFGPDREQWRFKCPRCAHALSLAEARVRFADLKGCGWRPESECIGRYTSAAGCDWCAYGLFRGPDFVSFDGKDVAVFAFAEVAGG